MLFHPDSVRTKTGGPYGVYTPFANACLALGGPREPLPPPASISGGRSARIGQPRRLGVVTEQTRLGVGPARDLDPGRGRRGRAGRGISGWWPGGL